eukprot:288033-Chlamydomonas_euryale.AAC.3
MSAPLVGLRPICFCSPSRYSRLCRVSGPCDITCSTWFLYAVSARPCCAVIVSICAGVGRG